MIYLIANNCRLSAATIRELNEAGCGDGDTVVRFNLAVHPTMRVFGGRTDVLFVRGNAEGFHGMRRDGSHVRVSSARRMVMICGEAKETDLESFGRMYDGVRERYGCPCEFMRVGRPSARKTYSSGYLAWRYFRESSPGEPVTCVGFDAPSNHAHDIGEERKEIRGDAMTRLV